MSYLVKYDDVTSVGAYVNGNCQTYGGQLQEISQSFTNIVGIPSLKGQAADSMKAYVGEVHGFIIQSISQLVQEIQSKFLLYKDGYYNMIDADNHAKLDENILESTLTFFRQSTNNFDIEHGKLEEVIQSVYDIINVSNISAYAVQDDYQHTTKQVSELKQLVGHYENDHATKDFTVFDAMLTSLKGLIVEAQAKDSSVVTHYQPRDLLQYKDSVALNGAVVASQEGIAANQTALDQAITNEGKRWEVLEQEAADKRAEEGIWNAVFAVGAVIIGGAAIVLTAGAATPLVVTAAIAGSASIAYGASNLVESSQDIYFGLHGAATTAAFNPLRDTVFMGNQGAYDAFGMVATTVAGACIPMGPAISAAKAGGTSVARATAVTLGKEATSFAVGSGAFFATEHFVAPIATDLFGEDVGRNVTRVSSLVAAIGAGGATYSGLSKLESAFGSRTVPKLATETPVTEAEGIPARPSWKKTETDVEADYAGYRRQVSFLDGKEVKYGTKGSVRPEAYDIGHSVEAKNYNVQTSSGRSNLVRNVSNQVESRVKHLPEGTDQTVIIDVRGQSVSNEILKEIRRKILEKSGVDVEILFKR
ncbi:hypothetical protein HB884_06665 [Listeria booriae]|uniref:T7SS effector LXG polymorphic toxin n=1 Tax=Listeria booriae TaxID=1552123 RepID=UPI0016266F6E|nr:T7SS effector LXG polymorphic toxin [Listeria booriae]MBC1523888.1 hypothetical protein [Listeria booriae]